MNLKDKICCVFDTGGNYISMAQRLSKDFEKVYYTTNWQTSYPKWNLYSVGMGVEEIERIDSIWDVVDEVDLFVFPDLYLGSLQKHLRDMGKIVFGAGMGENMEIYRDELKELMEDVGLPVNEHKIIKGFSKLKKYLSDKEDKFIKTNLIRGNGETFHYKNMKLSESRLDDMQHTLGSFKEMAVFIVEEPIPDAIEIGTDSFIIDGKHPENTLIGVEIKDCGYAGGMIQYDKVPKVLQTVDTKLSSYFEEHNYRCNFSTEVRWNGEKGYLIDSTCRLPQPPSDLQMLLFDNYSEIIWDVANGEIPVIKSKDKFGVQIIIKSDWATQEPQAIYFDPKYKDNIKIKQLMYKDETAYFVPCGIEMTEIGSVVATGKTLKEAIERAKEIAKTVEGDCIHVNGDALDAASEELNKLKKFNITLF